jgi:hypothetical protein
MGKPKTHARASLLLGILALDQVLTVALLQDALPSSVQVLLVMAETVDVAFLAAKVVTLKAGVSAFWNEMISYPHVWRTVK